MTDLYHIESPSFYEDQANSLNPLRRWFHRNRHKTIRELVKQYSNKGLVVDVGCGNCLWNDNSRASVIGIDVSKEALDFTQSTGRIQRGIVAAAHAITLPDSIVDAVVCTEVLEHLQNFQQAMIEARRILRPGGYYITSVPYDTLWSLWKPLFWGQCLFEGTIRGDEYYKKRCGHINAFSPSTISDYMAEAGFKVVEQFDMKRFTIFTVGMKVPNEVST